MKKQAGRDRACSRRHRDRCSVVVFCLVAADAVGDAGSLLN